MFAPALAAEPAKRTEVQKYLAEKFQKDLRPDAGTLAKLLSAAYPDYKAKAAEFAARIQTEEAKRRTFPEIRALYDLPGEAKTPLLRRGDYTNPGKEVSPGVLSVLSTAKPFAWTVARQRFQDERPTPGLRQLADATRSPPHRTC